MGAGARRALLPSSLGGQRQRVLFARIAASGADVALLDEPTSALDLVAGVSAESYSASSARIQHEHRHRQPLRAAGHRVRRPRGLARSRHPPAVVVGTPSGSLRPRIISSALRIACARAASSRARSCRLPCRRASTPFWPSPPRAFTHRLPIASSPRPVESPPRHRCTRRAPRSAELAARFAEEIGRSIAIRSWPVSSPGARARHGRRLHRASGAPMFVTRRVVQPGSRPGRGDAPFLISIHAGIGRRLPVLSLAFPVCPLRRRFIMAACARQRAVAQRSRWSISFTSRAAALVDHRRRRQRVSQEAHDIASILFEDGYSAVRRSRPQAARRDRQRRDHSASRFCARGLAFADFDPDAARVRAHCPFHCSRVDFCLSVAAVVAVATRALGALPGVRVRGAAGVRLALARSTLAARLTFSERSAARVRCRAPVTWRPCCSELPVRRRAGNGRRGSSRLIALGLGRFRR